MRQAWLPAVVDSSSSLLAGLGRRGGTLHGHGLAVVRRGAGLTFVLIALVVSVGATAAVPPVGAAVSATAVAGIASITANAAAYTERDVRILDLGLTSRTSYVLSTGRLRG